MRALQIERQLPPQRAKPVSFRAFTSTMAIRTGGVCARDIDISHAVVHGMDCGGGLGANPHLLMPAPPTRTLVDLFGAVVFAPLVETAILAGGLKLLYRLTQRPSIVAASRRVAGASYMASKRRCGFSAQRSASSCSRAPISGGDRFHFAMPLRLRRCHTS